MHACRQRGRVSCINFFDLCPSALKMASILQKLITPLFSGPPEPPRNKVTVVGVGQVGMACAVSILLKVRDGAVYAQITLLLLSQHGVKARILRQQITDLLASVPDLILWFMPRKRHVTVIIKGCSPSLFMSCLFPLAHHTNVVSVYRPF